MKRTTNTKMPLAEASELAKQYVHLDTQTKLLQAEKGARIRAVEEEYHNRFYELEKQSKVIFDKLQLFAQESRHTILFGGQKSTLFKGVIMKFRTAPPKVCLPEGVKEESIVEQMLKNGDKDYIVYKPRIDKAKYQLDYKSKEIATRTHVMEHLRKYGLSIEQDEHFSLIVPDVVEVFAESTLEPLPIISEGGE